MAGRLRTATSATPTNAASFTSPAASRKSSSAVVRRLRHQLRRGARGRQPPLRTHTARVLACDQLYQRRATAPLPVLATAGRLAAPASSASAPNPHWRNTYGHRSELSGSWTPSRIGSINAAAWRSTAPSLTVLAP